MRTSDVIEHFGTLKAAADALGIKSPSVSGWGEFVPPLRQLQLERITEGKLKADPKIREGTFDPRAPSAEQAA